MRQPSFPTVQYDITICKGGWDQISPPLSLKAGVLRDCLNVECSATGGYSRVGGYERFDGQLKPSDAIYSVVQVASFTNTPTVGQTLTGVSSGATGVIAALGANYMVLTKTSLSFSIPEEVRVGATSIGTTETTTASITTKQNAQYINAAADIYRADITAVPGSGSVLGIKVFNDIMYAFRNNAGGTAADMYKQSAAGWVQVNFEYEVSFSNANTGVEDGDTLTQGGVTATIRRVVVQTGTLLSGINTGRLVISVATGGNFAAGAATTTGAGTLTLSGAESAITLLPNGKFEFDIANFFGQTLRMYGCDGVNRMFEFDGTYFVPLATSVVPDTPKYLIAFKNHLMCQIGASNISSGINNPHNWTTTAGAHEKSLGDTLTGYAIQPGSSVAGTVAIFGRSNVFMLYGTSTADWNYITYAQGVGALDYTAQQMAQTFFFDDRGVNTLQTSQAYGNFDQATLTNNINTFIRSNRNKISCSSLSRERSQYRLFFSNGYGLYATIVNGKYLGSAQVYFDNPATCTCEGEMSNGDEALFFGSSNGMVYQLDKGSSFDGEPISGYAKFNWNYCGSPRILKRWRKGSIEIQGFGYAEISFGYGMAYDSTEEIQAFNKTYTSNFSATNWDAPGITWEEFQWDGCTISPSEVEMVGTSENVQITVNFGSDYLYPFTIHSFILHYTPRRGIR